MNRKVVIGVVGFGVGVALMVSAGFTLAQDAKAANIEAIMKKNHGKKGGLVPQIGELVKGGKVGDALPQAKQVAALAADLGKNKPKKGEQKSWDELCKAYADAAKDLQAAVEKKDTAAAKTALSTIGGSCKACHEAHKK